MSKETVDAKWFDKPEEPEAKRRKPTRAPTVELIDVAAASASSTTSEVRVPVDTLRNYIHELDKTVATAEKTTELFKSATAAFEEQQTALDKVAGELRKLL